MKKMPLNEKIRMVWALVGGGLAWILHFLVIYAAAEWGCLLQPSDLLGLSITHWIIFGVTLISLALAGLALVFSVKTDHVFLQRYGWWTNGLFLFFILMETTPVFFYLKEC